MKYIHRDTSVITGKKNLKPLLQFKKFPVFIGATSQPKDKDVFADLSFSIDKDSGIIQLDKLLPPDIIYSEYHSEALGKVWEDHHKEFLKFISKAKISSVLEIGGSNGALAKAYIAKHKIKKWIIVEPNPAVEDDKIIKVIPTLFDEKTKIDEKVDAVIHSHVLEHIYTPREFMSHVANFMDKGSYHIFSVPNLYAYLKNKQSNTINFEHTIFITEYFIDYLLKMYGFKIIEKKKYLEHSIFYMAQKQKNVKVKIIEKYTGEKKYKEYKKLFQNAMDEIGEFVEEINKKAETVQGPLYLFGAHVFSQMLLYRGITPKIKGILDNSQLKQGKRLYGTTQKILSPDVIKKDKNPTVILRVGAYQDEVKKQLVALNPHITIWE